MGLFDLFDFDGDGKTDDAEFIFGMNIVDDIIDDDEDEDEDEDDE